MSKPISNHFYRTIGEGKALISSLSARKEKFSMDDVVAITKDPSGKIVWLEKGKLGDRASRLAHILDKHSDDFKNQGISKEEIPQYIMMAIKYGKILGKQGRHGRPNYEFKYEGKIRRIAITVGDNGYIVGANPVSLPKEDQ